MEEGAVLRTLMDEAEQGLNFLAYDLSVDQVTVPAGEDEQTLEAADNGVYYMLPGQYQVHFQLGEAEDTVTLRVSERRR